MSARGSAGINDDDARGRRHAGAQLRDENSEKLYLGEEELALAPVVGRARGVR